MTGSLRRMVDQRPMTTYQWSAVGVCMVLNMIDGFDVLVMAFTAASVSAEWKLNGAKLGLLLSAGLFGMAGGSLFIAPWADRIGRRPLTLLCLPTSAIGMLLSAAAQSGTQLALCRVITGLGVGGILACSNVIASEYASERWRGLAVSLQSTGYAIGAAVGGSIAVGLLSHFGWRSVFVFGGCVTLSVMLLVLWRLPESLDFLLARRPAGALARLNRFMGKMGLEPLAELPAAAAQTRNAGNGLLQLLSPALLRPTLLVWLSFFTVTFGYYFVMSWTPKLLAASGMTPQQGVTGGVLLALGGIIGTALLGLLAARFRVNVVLACFALLTAVLLSLLGSNPGSPLVSFSLAFLLGMFVNGCIAGLYAIGPIVYEPSLRVTGVGWGMGVGRIGAIVSPLVAGALLDDGWRPVQLYVGYGLAFVAAAVIVLMHRLQPSTATQERLAGRIDTSQ